MSEVKSNRAWRLECETLQQDVVRLLAERTHMRTELLQDIERLTAELAECKDMQKVDQRVLEQLTETRDLAEHWMIIAEQRRVELGGCRKDAERYRWLRESDWTTDGILSIHWSSEDSEHYIEAELDAAIDAAMEAKP